jgi:hypothetical protein
MYPCIYVPPRVLTGGASPRGRSVQLSIDRDGGKRRRPVSADAALVNDTKTKNGMCLQLNRATVPCYSPANSRKEWDNIVRGMTVRREATKSSTTRSGRPRREAVDPDGLRNTFIEAVADPSVEAKASADRGRGLFATRAFKRGEYVIAMKEPQVTSVRRPGPGRVAYTKQGIRPHDTDISFKYHGRDYIWYDGTMPTLRLGNYTVASKGRAEVPTWYRLNHCPNGNLKLTTMKGLTIGDHAMPVWSARRPIEKGEELCFKYDKTPCTCRKKKRRNERKCPATCPSMWRCPATCQSCNAGGNGLR